MNEIEAGIPKSVERPVMLVGEGREEVLCFTALLKHLHIVEIQVEEYKGKSGLLPYLRTLKTRPGFAQLRVLGVTQDADSDPDGAWAGIRAAIQNADLPSRLKVDCFVCRLFCLARSESERCA